MGEVQRHWWEQQGWISTCSTNVQQDWWRDARSCPYVLWKYLSHCIIRLIKLLHSEESTSDWTWIQRPYQVSIEIPEEGTAEEFWLLHYSCHSYGADILFTPSCMNARWHRPEAGEHCSPHPPSWISSVVPRKEMLAFHSIHRCEK